MATEEDTVGPTEEALSLADYLLTAYPQLATDRYTLGYAIDAWAAETDGKLERDDAGT